MAMATTPARADQPIEAKVLNLTKVVTTSGTVVGVGVAAFLQQLGDRADAVQAAALGFLGLLALAIGTVAAVDILARARVTVAKEASQAAGSPQIAALSEPLAPTLGSVMAPVTTPITLTARGAGNGHRVIAVRWDEQAKQTYYLASQPGEAPRWCQQNEITDVTYSPTPPHTAG